MPPPRGHHEEVVIPPSRSPGRRACNGAPHDLATGRRLTWSRLSGGRGSSTTATGRTGPGDHRRGAGSVPATIWGAPAGAFGDRAQLRVSGGEVETNSWSPTDLLMRRDGRRPGTIRGNDLARTTGRPIGSDSSSRRTTTRIRFALSSVGQPKPGTRRVAVTAQPDVVDQRKARKVLGPIGAPM